MGETGFRAARGTVRARAARDLALWAVLAGAGVHGYRQQSDPSPVLTLLLPLLVLAAAVPIGRSRPGVAVFLANALVALGLARTVPTASPYLVALAVMAYLLGSRRAAVRGPLALLGACTAFDLAVCAVLDVDVVYWFYTLSMVPVALVLPWLAGRYRRARRHLVRGGWQRARSLERQQRFVAERAGLRERARIAADMHDSLGHELSLIALRAGALELSPTLAGQDRRDLAELRTTIADAVGHLRDTIGVLRAGPEGGYDTDGGAHGADGSGHGAHGADGTGPDPASAPSLTPSSAESVEGLVRRVRESGAPVELRREGMAPALSPLVDRTLYRVVQESVTNALKHAPGAAIRIGVTHGDGRTVVRVRNAAPAAPPARTPAGGGHGLVGLRERVRLIGGTLRTAPRDGGYELLATLPDLVPPPRPAAPAARPPDVGVAHRHAEARRSARRRFAVAAAVPAGFALLTLVCVAYLAQQLTACVLTPTAFATLRPGQDRAEVARALPSQEFRHVPDAVRARPAPDGTVCAFYRSNGNLLDPVDVYRLCYAGSRLVAADALPG
ncbi:sensor histidine kinase [Streptomyces sp. NPDC057939]|uniref:sensor histidine kinase n=1 Tax=Streptomyces sp. NPDC057939 TaxID=3346284 RepID=UPI0036ED99EB